MRLAATRAGVSKKGRWGALDPRAARLDLQAELGPGQRDPGPAA